MKSKGYVNSVLCDKKASVFILQLLVQCMYTKTIVHVFVCTLQMLEHSCAHYVAHG